MDSKVLRAAVSAAIRVTLSTTTLLGCGGNVTSGNDQRAPSTDESPAQATDAPPNDDIAPTSATAAGGTPTSGGQVGDAGSGGSSIASQGGSPEGGQSPLGPVDTCSAVDACLSRFDARTPTLPLDDVDAACCQTAIDGLMSLQAIGPTECWADLNQRFMLSAAHRVCCTSLEAWQIPACTPWGPPVPPELPETALRAWGAAA